MLCWLLFSSKEESSAVSRDNFVPIRAAVSDEETNDASFWPEFDDPEPEPENDPDFAVSDTFQMIGPRSIPKSVQMKQWTMLNELGLYLNYHLLNGFET